MMVSVALATYNGETYLPAQLGSLTEQTRLPDELVVCDDGSNDRTVEILESFAKVSPFVVRIYRNKERLGYSRNFERAIQLCRGDIIFLCDQDDVWFPRKIETVLHAFQSPVRPLVVANDAELTKADLTPTGLTVTRQLRAAGFSLDSFVIGCCTAFRAEFRVLILPVPHNHSVHDTWIHHIGIALDRRIFLPEPLQYYRRHGTNTSNWFANSSRPVSILDRIKHYALGDSQGACIKRLALLEELFTRLQDKGRELESLLGENLQLDAALYGIMREKEAVMRRLNVLRTRRIFRWLPAWRMLRAGDYAYFSGWASLIKDLLQ